MKRKIDAHSRNKMNGSIAISTAISATMVRIE